MDTCRQSASPLSVHYHPVELVRRPILLISHQVRRKVVLTAHDLIFLLHRAHSASMEPLTQHHLLTSHTSGDRPLLTREDVEDLVRDGRVSTGLEDVSFPEQVPEVALASEYDTGQLQALQMEEMLHLIEHGITTMLVAKARGLS